MSDGKMRQKQVMSDAKNRLNFGVGYWTTQLTMTEMLNGSWQLRKSWSVLHNKTILTSLRRMFPYISGKHQIRPLRKSWSELHNKAILTSLWMMFSYILEKDQFGKYQIFMNHMNFGWKKSLLLTRQC